MAVSCPADGCDFDGTMDQVEGHIGGVADDLHEGIVESELVQSLQGEGNDGLPIGLLAVVGLVLLVLMFSSDSSSSPTGPSLGLDQASDRDDQERSL